MQTLEDLSSETVTMFLSFGRSALQRRTSPIHKYTRRIGLEDNCLETHVLPLEVVCHSRAILCQLITAVLTRQQLYVGYTC